MKKICVFGLLLLSTAAMAQYGVNGESGRYRVVDFPKYYVEQGNRTFSVNVEMSKKVSGYADAEETAEKIKFKGWTKTSEDQANMKMTVDFGEFIYMGTEILDQSTEEKAKDGSVKRVPKYVGSFSYTFPITITTMAPEGNEERGLNLAFNKVLQTVTFTDDKIFSSRAQASEYMKENKDVFIERTIIREVSSAVNSAINLATKTYGFGETHAVAEYVFLDSKKSPYFESQKNANIQLKELFKTSLCTEPISSDVLTPIINEYIDIINGLDNADKKQAKARVKLMLSVAEFYLMLDDLDSSATWAQRVFDEYQEKDGKKILERINVIRSLFEKHHVTSRHFDQPAPVIAE